MKSVYAKARLLAFSASLLLLVIGVSVQARDYPEANNRQTQTAKPARISAGQAANIAQSATGAKVLAVTFRRGYYRVKLLRNNGVILTVKVNADTGRMSR